MVWSLPISCPHTLIVSIALRPVPYRKGTRVPRDPWLQGPTTASMRTRERARLSAHSMQTHVPPGTTAHTCRCLLLQQKSARRAHTHTRTCAHTLPRALTHRHVACAQDPEGVEPCQQPPLPLPLTPVPASAQPSLSMPRYACPSGNTENTMTCVTCVTCVKSTQLREPWLRGQRADSRKDRVRTSVHSVDRAKPPGGRHGLWAADTSSPGRCLPTGGTRLPRKRGPKARAGWEGLPTPSPEEGSQG